MTPRSTPKRKQKLIRDTDTAPSDRPVFSGGSGSGFDDERQRWMDELFQTGSRRRFTPAVGGRPLQTPMKPSTWESFHSFLLRRESSFCAGRERRPFQRERSRSAAPRSSRGLLPCLRQPLRETLRLRTRTRTGTGGWWGDSVSRDSVGVSPTPR